MVANKRPKRKNAAKRRNKKTRRKAGAPGFHEAVQYLCCKGPIAQYPDGPSSVVPFRQVTRFPLTFTSEGEHAFWVLPGSVESPLYVAQQIVANAATQLSPVTGTDFNTIKDSYQMYRVNACCVMVEYVHSALENEGMLAAKTFNTYTANLGAAVAVPGGWPRSLTSRGTDEHYGRTADGLCWLSSPIDSSAHVFTPLDGTTESAYRQSAPWEALGVYMTGKASQIVVAVTVIQDIELVATSGWAARTTRPGAPASAPAQDLIKNSSTALAGVKLQTKHAGEALMSKSTEVTALQRFESGAAYGAEGAGLATAAFGPEAAPIGAAIGGIYGFIHG